MCKKLYSICFTCLSKFESFGVSLLLYYWFLMRKTCRWYQKRRFWIVRELAPFQVDCLLLLYVSWYDWFIKWWIFVYDCELYKPPFAFLRRTTSCFYKLSGLEFQFADLFPSLDTFTPYRKDMCTSCTLINAT